MRLVIAVVQDKDSNRLADRLVKNGLRATKLASTGGFLKAGNTTFLIGVEDARVEQALQVIKENCCAREQMLPALTSMAQNVDTYLSPVTVQVGGATVFVLDVEQFVHF